MADDALDTLTTTALNALASSPGGQMTVPDLVTHVESRQGPTDEAAQDATSPETRSFLATLQGLVHTGGEGSLIDRGLATADESGGLVSITQAGRDYVGR